MAAISREEKERKEQKLTDVGGLMSLEKGQLFALTSVDSQGDITQV